MPLARPASNSSGSSGAALGILRRMIVDGATFDGDNDTGETT
jgi:hypothetical protein